MWPDASVHVTSNIPSTAVSYTKMTGTGHGTVQVRAVFANGLKSAYTPTRDVVHTIAEPGGTKTQLINKPGKLALTFAWNTKTNAKQYKVQVSRNPGFSQHVPGRETTDQASYTPLLTQQDFIDGGVMYWRVAVDRPGRQHRRVLEGQEVHDPGAHAGADRRRARQGHAPASSTVTVLNAKGKPIKGAAVKLQGAGVKTKAKKTNKKGVVTFTIKPKRAGNLAATATEEALQGRLDGRPGRVEPARGAGPTPGTPRGPRTPQWRP